MMRRLQLDLLCGSVLIASLMGGPAIAQEQPQVSDAQLRGSFRQGFLKGCSAGKTKGIKNQAEFCSCLADSYNKRYNGMTLSAISGLAGQSGAKGPLLVDVMMTPERQACASSN